MLILDGWRVGRTITTSSEPRAFYSGQNTSQESKSSAWSLLAQAIVGIAKTLGQEVQKPKTKTSYSLSYLQAETQIIKREEEKKTETTAWGALARAVVGLAKQLQYATQRQATRPRPPERIFHRSAARTKAVETRPITKKLPRELIRRLPLEERAQLLLEEQRLKIKNLLKEIKTLAKKIKSRLPSVAEEVERLVSKFESIPSIGLLPTATTIAGTPASLIGLLNQIKKGLEAVASGKGKVVQGLYGTYVITQEGGKYKVYVLSLNQKELENYLIKGGYTPEDYMKLVQQEIGEIYIQHVLSQVQPRVNIEVQTKFQKELPEILKNIGTEIKVEKGQPLIIGIFNPNIQSEIKDILLKRYGIKVEFRNGQIIPSPEALQKYGERLYDIINQVVGEVLNKYIEPYYYQTYYQTLAKYFSQYGIEVKVSAKPSKKPSIKIEVKPSETKLSVVFLPTRRLYGALTYYTTKKSEWIKETLQELFKNVNVSTLTLKEAKELLEKVERLREEAVKLGRYDLARLIEKRYLEPLKQRVAVLKTPIEPWRAGLAGFVSAIMPTIAVIGEGIARGFESVGLRGVAGSIRGFLKEVHERLITDLERAKVTGGLAALATQIGATVGSVLNIAQVAEVAAPFVGLSEVEKVIALRRELQPGISISIPTVGALELKLEDIAAAVIPWAAVRAGMSIGARVGGAVGRAIMRTATTFAKYTRLAPEVLITEKAVAGLGKAIRATVRVVAPRLERVISLLEKERRPVKIYVETIVPVLELKTPTSVEVKLIRRYVSVPAEAVERLREVYRRLEKTPLYVTPETRKVIERGTVLLVYKSGEMPTLTSAIPIGPGVYPLHEIKKIFGSEIIEKLLKKRRVEIPTIFVLSRGKLYPTASLLKLLARGVRIFAVEIPEHVYRSIREEILKGERRPMIRIREVTVEKPGVGIGRAVEIAVRGVLSNARKRIVEFTEIRGPVTRAEITRIKVPVLERTERGAVIRKVREIVAVKVTTGAKTKLTVLAKERKLTLPEATRTQLEAVLSKSIKEVRGEHVRFVTRTGEETITKAIEKVKSKIEIKPTPTERAKAALRELRYRIEEARRVKRAEAVKPPTEKEQTPKIKSSERVTAKEYVPEVKPTGEKAPEVAVVEKTKSVERVRIRAPERIVIKWEKIGVRGRLVEIPAEIKVRSSEIKVRYDRTRNRFVIAVRGRGLVLPPELVEKFRRFINMLDEAFRRRFGEAVKVSARIGPRGELILYLFATPDIFLDLILPRLLHIIKMLESGGIILDLFRPKLKMKVSLPQLEKFGRPVKPLTTLLRPSRLVETTETEAKTVEEKTGTGHLTGAASTAFEIPIEMPFEVTLTVELLRNIVPLPELIAELMVPVGGRPTSLKPELLRERRPWVWLDILLAAVQRYLNLTFGRPGYVKTMKQMLVL